MARSKLLADVRVPGKRHKTPGCCDPAPADHHGPVMQGRAGEKKADKQLLAQPGINGVA